jgi:hypothetical protein
MRLTCWIRSLISRALVQDVAHRSLLRSSRQRLHARIADALESHSPELKESQPELFAQHYAEAGLVEKSVACWGKAGHRSVAHGAIVEAAAQFQKGLDQLALLPDNPERQRQELEYCSSLSAALRAARGQAANSRVQSGIVWAAYKQWCADRGYSAVSHAMFGRLARWRKDRIGGTVWSLDAELAEGYSGLAPLCGPKALPASGAVVVKGTPTAQ